MVSYIHTEAFAVGKLKYGPKALIEQRTPVFAGLESEEKILSNAQEVKARGGFIIGISGRNDPAFDYWIKVPESRDFKSIIQAILSQIPAYWLAVHKGLDPGICPETRGPKCMTVP